MNKSSLADPLRVQWVRLTHKQNFTMCYSKCHKTGREEKLSHRGADPHWRCTSERRLQSPSGYNTRQLGGEVQDMGRKTAGRLVRVTDTSESRMVSSILGNGGSQAVPSGVRIGQWSALLSLLT